MRKEDINACFTSVKLFFQLLEQRKKLVDLKTGPTWSIYLIGRTSFLYQNCAQNQLCHHHILTNGVFYFAKLASSLKKTTQVIHPPHHGKQLKE